MAAFELPQTFDFTTRPSSPRLAVMPPSFKAKHSEANAILGLDTSSGDMHSLIGRNIAASHPLSSCNLRSWLISCPCSRPASSRRRKDIAGFFGNFSSIIATRPPKLEELEPG